MEYLRRNTYGVYYLVKDPIEDKLAKLWRSLMPCRHANSHGGLLLLFYFSSLPSLPDFHTRINLPFDCVNVDVFQYLSSALRPHHRSQLDNVSLKKRGMPIMG